MLLALCHKKRKILAIAVIQLIVLSTVSLFVGQARANFMPESVPPPDDAKLPIISVSPIENNTVYAQAGISLTINVTTPKPKLKYRVYLQCIEYKADWQGKAVQVYKTLFNPGARITDFFDEIEITGIHDGAHNITFTAALGGSFGLANHPIYFMVNQIFGVSSNLTIHFIVDTTPPIILVPPIQNTTSASIALNYSINEPTTKVLYSLDAQSNITAPKGNITLTNLPIGKHNITVYSRDEAENIGASETVTFFTVAKPEPEPFPALPIALVSVACGGIVASSLLVFSLRHKNRQGTINKFAV